MLHCLSQLCAMVLISEGSISSCLEQELTFFLLVCELRKSAKCLKMSTVGTLRFKTSTEESVAYFCPSSRVKLWVRKLGRNYKQGVGCPDSCLDLEKYNATALHEIKEKVLSSFGHSGLHTHTLETCQAFDSESSSTIFHYLNLK